MIHHPDPTVQTLVNELVEQRNDALDKLATTKAELAESNNAISALSTRIAELQGAKNKSKTPPLT